MQHAELHAKQVIIRGALNKANGLAIAIAAATLLGSGSAQAQAEVIIDDSGCLVFDAAGTLHQIDAPAIGGDAVVQAVSTPSGNSKITCSGTLPPLAVVPGADGGSNRAVINSDFLCNTKFGATLDSHNVVTKSGRVTLTCYVNQLSEQP